MKKITNEGIIHYIKPLPIHINWLMSDHRIFPYYLKFTFEILCPINVKPTLQGMNIEFWFESVFYNKVISDASNNNSEIVEFAKLITGSSNPIIFIEKLDSDYLANTIFNIVANTLDDNCKLISLTYE